MRRWLLAWESYRMEVDDYLDAGDSVVIRFRESGRGRGTGVPVEQERDRRLGASHGEGGARYAVPGSQGGPRSRGAAGVGAPCSGASPIRLGALERARAW